MKLTSRQVKEFHEQGFLLLENLFTSEEVGAVNAAVISAFAEDSPARILEKDGVHVRTVFGAHTNKPALGCLALHPRILEPARQLIGGEVYIHQFKVNAKVAFAGDVWQWHQDYIYWQREDGMQKADALTVAFFLDDVTEFNGPLLMVPKSHRLGVIETEARDTAPGWQSTVIADLKYSLGRETMEDVVRREGIVAPKGRRGSVLFFHCNTVHGSATNMSPVDRRVVFITYNDVQNALEPRDEPRPWFMANRDPHPLTAVADDALSTPAGTAAPAR